MSIKKSLWFIIITVFFIVVWVAHLLAVSEGAYVTNASELYRLEPVVLLSRAYKVGKGPPLTAVEFEDSTRKRFVFEFPNYSDFRDNKFLYDTLQYSGVRMTVLINRQGHDNYAKKEKDEIITVYNIIIGSYSFTKDGNINYLEFADHRLLLNMLSVGYGICVLVYFYRRRIGKRGID